MECSCINQNIEFHLSVFLLCEIIQSTHKLIYLCENKTKVVFHVYKAVIACQTRLQYAIGKAT